MGASCIRPNANIKGKLDPNGHRYMTEEEYFNLDPVLENSTNKFYNKYDKSNEALIIPICMSILDLPTPDFIYHD